MEKISPWFQWLLCMITLPFLLIWVYMTIICSHEKKNQYHIDDVISAVDDIFNQQDEIFFINGIQELQH